MPDRVAMEQRVAELLRELKAREVESRQDRPLPPLSPVIRTPEVALRHLRRVPAMVEVIRSNDQFRGVKSSVLIDEIRMIEKAIFGDDDRLDLFEIVHPRREDILREADAVVSLFLDSAIRDNGDGTSTVTTAHFGTVKNLCTSERFREQPVGCYGTGFVVAPDLIATAGHCVAPEMVRQVRFVFGFRMIDGTRARTVIENREIYQGAALVGREQTPNQSDWALVRVDRPITGHRPLALRRTPKISDSESLYVIGHPVGLPCKYAAGANVLNNTPEAFFHANLDTYAGNSGSPVFNFRTREVEGILAGGEVDFMLDPEHNCRKSRLITTTGFQGESCTRSTQFASLVPLG